MGKLGKGFAIRSQSCEIVENVRKCFQAERERGGPSHPYAQITARVSAATGVGLVKVKKICHEADVAASTGQSFPSETPGKKRKRLKTVTACDNFTLEAIRRRIHRFYLEGEIPTLHKLLHVLKNEFEGDTNVNNGTPIFSGCVESLRRVLINDLGFKFCKIDNRKHLLERTDVVSLRLDFLQRIRYIDLNTVYFLDETWVNQNHSVSSCWQSEECYGKKVPIGKGKRLILLHAGSAKGFVPECQLLFVSNSGKADYHQDMNAKVFTDWFKTKLLNNIPPNSVIIMDNAPYHSVQLCKPPTMCNRKKDIQNWLEENQISYDDSMVKAQLYELVKMNKPRQKRYVIDEMASEAPHFCKVIRLPPYHCQFNAIEMIWADVKRYVAVKNKTFKMADLQNLTEKAITTVSPDTWKKYVQHTKKIIDEYMSKDQLIEIAIEPLIISLGQESDSDSSGDNSEQDSDIYADSTDEYSDDLESSFTPLEY